MVLTNKVLTNMVLTNMVSTNVKHGLDKRGLDKHGLFNLPAVLHLTPNLVYKQVGVSNRKRPSKLVKNKHTALTLILSHSF